MRKILSYLTALAVIVTTVTAGVVPAQADYSACGPVKGGNTTFLVCNGRQINHFWSGTKIRVKNITDNVVKLVMINPNGFRLRSNYYINQPEVRQIGVINNKEVELTITYLGRDSVDPNRVLIKVDSNTTYEDSFNQIPEPQPEPQPEVLLTPQIYSATKSDNNALTFYWDAIEGADYYNFQVKKIVNSDTTTTVLVDDVHDVYADHFDNFIPSSGDGHYYIRVMAKNNNGQSSEWSYYYYFEYSAPVNNNIPQPVLTASEPYYQGGSFYVDLNWDNIEGNYSYYSSLEFSSDGTNYSLYTFHTNAGSLGTTFEVNDFGYYRAKVSRYLGDWNNNTESDYVYFTVGLNIDSAPVLHATEAFSMYQDRYVTFYWDNLIIPNDFLVVEYSNTDANYSEIYNDSIYNSQSVSILVHNAGYYRAYIRRFDGIGFTDSNYVAFYLDDYNDNNNQTLAIPTITYPSQNQRIYHDKNNIDNYGLDLSSMDLYTTWNYVDDASSYEVSYERDDNGNWNDYGTYTQTDAKDILSHWIDTGSYRVRVRALGNSNQTSPWSEWTYFEIYNHGNQTSSWKVAPTDMTVEGYKDLSVTHSPTYINIKVLGYDENYVVLEMTDAVWNKMYVKRGESYTVLSSDPNINRGLRVYFEDITDQGVKLRLETVYPQAV